MLLRDAGKDAVQIKEILEAEKFESTIYITVDTLKYLKKGGRITPAAAALGTVLNLKPVLQIQGEKMCIRDRTVADNIEIVVFRELLERFCDTRIERAGFFKKQFVLIFKA